MTYVWRCKTCGAEIEVTRKMMDNQIPPTDTEGTHEACGGREFKRVMLPPRHIYVIENYNPETGRE